MLDLKGNLWVNGNRSNKIYFISPEGAVIDTLAGSESGVTYLSHPIGNAADSQGNVWVSNSDWLDTPCRTRLQLGTAANPSPTALSRFCGVDTKKCAPGMKVGDPISPSTGYQSDAIERITGGQIDQSGTVWITNNWKIDGDPVQNPGGNAVVVAVGAAVPIKTPLIGPPRSFK